MGHLRIIWSLNTVCTVHNGLGSPEYDKKTSSLHDFEPREEGDLQQQSHVWTLLWGLGPLCSSQL